MIKVDVRRDETGWWIATSPDVAGMVTQARRLDQIAARAREAIALVLDVPLRSVDLEVRNAEQEREAVKAYRRARAEAELLQGTVGVTATAAARELTGAGLSMRDAGEVLGLSHQRVQQLVRGPKTTTGKRHGNARTTVGARKAAAARSTKKATARTSTSKH
jgi:predicted RNase H-like HicB family nuclease